MAESIFPGFKNRMVLVGDQRISVHVGGSGTPLLLLHGYPQNHAAWIKLAGPLAKDFTCVIADLPGYGASSIPVDAPDHESFSKRRMASLFVSAMASMGYSTFSIMGHDRGARVAYRMALDHPTTIGRVVIIEIIPTSDMWKAFNAEMAMKAYHWSFLAQPFPLPETLIAGDPTFYLEGRCGAGPRVIVSMRSIRDPWKAIKSRYATLHACTQCAKTIAPVRR